MLCSNSTENNYSCKSKEEILQNLNIFFAAVIFKDNIVDASNYTDPIKPTFKNKLIRISATSSRQEIYYFSNFSFESDNGFLFSDIAKKNSFTYDSKESDLIIDDNTEYIYRILLTVKQNRLKYLRTYSKITDVAANVGGLAKFITMILMSINYILAKISFLRYFKEYLVGIENKRGNKAITIQNNIRNKLMIKASNENNSANFQTIRSNQSNMKPSNTPYKKLLS